MSKLGFEVDGKMAICYERNANVTYWLGASPNFARAAKELESEGEIHKEIVSPIIYYIDRTILEIPPATTRQLNYLIENWGDATWIKDPMWIPVILMPRGVEMADLIQEPITPKMLRVALDSSDREYTWQARINKFISEMPGTLTSLAGENCQVNQAGVVEKVSTRAGAGEDERSE